MYFEPSDVRFTCNDGKGINLLIASGLISRCLGTF
jgi:hypothetical protein